MNKSFTVGLFILLMSVLVNCASSTPFQFTVGQGANNHWYEKIVGDQISWENAKSQAASSTYNSISGHLATITSQEENNFIKSMAGPTPSNLVYWIGGFQTLGITAPDGGWQWITDEPWVYTNWDLGEPNDYMGPESEDKLVVGTPGTWNDATPNGVVYGYIVEYEGLPFIEDITVKGPMGDANPVTTEEVTLKAIIKDVPGYEITKVSWSGDGIPANAEGKIYTYTPSRGSHGNKNIQATITYENTATGAIGQDSKNKEFKLFFIKNGDDDRNGNPNWFDYWNQLNVGNRHGISGVKYDKNLEPCGLYYPGTHYVTIGPKGAGTYIIVSSGTTINGIDLFTLVLAHECAHYNHWNMWFNGKTWPQPWSRAPDGDYDSDMIPNYYEDSGIDGIPKTSDQCEGDFTWNGAEKYNVVSPRTNHQDNIYKDDQEWLTYTETDNYNIGPHNQDWASPGKQTNPPESYSISNYQFQEAGLYGRSQTTPSASYQIVEDKWGKDYFIPLLSPPAKFNGIYSDNGIDTDSDKLYNYLEIEVGLDAVTAGSYSIGCGLEDSNGNTIWANNTVNLNTGTQTVKLNFDGLTIRQHRVNGPYSLVLLNLYNESETLVDYVDVAYNTSAYNYVEFQTPSEGLLSDNYADFGIDTDSDGLYEYLTVKVGLNVKTAGDYAIKGWLYDSNGTSIIMANNSTALGGGSQLVSLNFDGLTLCQHRNNGPYYLKDLILYDGDGKEIDYIIYAYTTSAYRYTDFQDSYLDWNPWNDPDSHDGESIALSELQTAIYDWRFGVTLPNGEKVDLTRLQELIYSWRFG